MGPQDRDREIDFRRWPHERRRREMVEETSSFLSWALRNGKVLPRIPRRRVDRGGFRSLLKRPGARAAVQHWWHRVLDDLGV